MRSHSRPLVSSATAREELVQERGERALLGTGRVGWAHLLRLHRGDILAWGDGVRCRCLATIARRDHLSRHLCWLGGCIMPAQQARKIGTECTVLGCISIVWAIWVEWSLRGFLEISHYLLSRSGRCHVWHNLLFSASQLLNDEWVTLLDLALQAYDVDLEETYSVTNLFFELCCSSSLTFYINDKIRFL